MSKKRLEVPLSLSILGESRIRNSSMFTVNNERVKTARCVPTEIENERVG